MDAVFEELDLSFIAVGQVEFHSFIFFMYRYFVPS